ncbi:biotin--[acetyl-CoA-carboxylase] ligase [bacterium]|nr:MAG: biotin--[acetyl-CoA-carboxylase] ligase [bacterium]
MKIELFPMIKFYKKVGSTNALAIKFLEDSTFQKNFVICAGEQTNGVGRLERIWYSPVGGLWFTLAFPCNKFHSYITLFTGVVIHKVLSSIFPELTFSIKWANDIFVNNKKLGGILTSSNKNGTVIGIGIDCNIIEIPDHLKETATSLLIETNRKLVLKKLLKVILKTFEENFYLFNEKGFPHFVEYFNQHHYLAHKRVLICSSENQIVGIVKGVTKDGMLMLKTEKGLQSILSADKIDIIT